jgi:hypothetical protein
MIYSKTSISCIFTFRVSYWNLVISVIAFELKNTRWTRNISISITVVYNKKLDSP